MDDQDELLHLPQFSNRRNLAFLAARTIALVGHRLLVKPHVEFHEDLVRVRRQADSVFVYVGLHKSLWETSGVLVHLLQAGVPLPFVGMGDNLVHGRLFQSLSRSVGIFLIRRPSSRRDVLESARRLRNDILGFVARGLDVLIFPEGTRTNVPVRGEYGDFFPAAFEPLLEYERTKERICAANPGLRPLNIHVVPVNVDYSRVREAHELVAQDSRRPRTLHVLDSLAMIRNIGDTYVSFGKPRPVAERLGLDRKRLAAETRQRCLELVKILPINVACQAILRLDPKEPFAWSRLEAAVNDVVAALAPRADRFRGFVAGDTAAAIVARARQSQLRFDRFDPQRVPLYRLYADYVKHHMPASGATA